MICRPQIDFSTISRLFEDFMSLMSLQQYIQYKYGDLSVCNNQTLKDESMGKVGIEEKALEVFLFYFICGHIPLLVIRADYCLNRCRVLGLSGYKKLMENQNLWISKIGLLDRTSHELLMNVSILAPNFGWPIDLCLLARPK